MKLTILLWKCLWSLHHLFSLPSAVTKMERTVKKINLCPEPHGGLALTDCQTSTQLLSHSSPWKGRGRKWHRKPHGLIKVQLLRKANTAHGSKVKRGINSLQPISRQMSSCFLGSKASIGIGVAWEDGWHHHKCPPIILLSFNFYFQEGHHMAWDIPLVMWVSCPGYSPSQSLAHLQPTDLQSCWWGVGEKALTLC